MAWGVCQIAEDEVRALPELAGRDVLELGCGACQWSIALAGRGARSVGLRDYFGLRSAEFDGAIDFQLGHGDWIRLFAANGLHLLDLIELRPPADAVSSYRDERSRERARRWPMDHIWQLRKL